MNTWALVVSSTRRVVSMATSAAAPGNPPPGHDYCAVTGGMPAGGAAGCELREVGGVLAWVDARTVTDAKAQAWERIKAAREAAFDEPLATPYGTFDSDATARSNITDAVLLAQTLASQGQAVALEFTLSNNSTATLNAQQMVTVGLLLGQKIQAAYAQGRARRAQIETCTTLAQADAIQW